MTNIILIKRVPRPLASEGFDLLGNNIISWSQTKLTNEYKRSLFY